MSSSAPGTAHLSFTSRTPSVIALGADALLAALPATPVQLAHACMRAGYQHVVPASWGDELVAGAIMRALDGHESLPAIACSCPIVAHRLLAVGTELRRFLISLVSPPVALARYLRALHGSTELRITFVGRCPGADDPVIDSRLTPEELFELFAQRQIVPAAQPAVFDSVLPPDRRRHLSLPGGLPAPDALWSTVGSRRLVELGPEDFSIELTQLLLSDEPVLIDACAALGCACAGAAGGDAALHRAQLTTLEPPRSPTPIVEVRVPVELELPLPASPQQPSHAPGVVSPIAVHQLPPTADVAVQREVVKEQVAVAAATEVPDDDLPVRATAEIEESLPVHHEVEPEAAREEMPDGEQRALAPGAPRTVLGELPMRRQGGRQLPRSYVLHRRHAPRDEAIATELPTLPLASTTATATAPAIAPPPPFSPVNHPELPADAIPHAAANGAAHYVASEPAVAAPERAPQSESAAPAPPLERSPAPEFTVTTAEGADAAVDVPVTLADAGVSAIAPVITPRIAILPVMPPPPAREAPVPRRTSARSTEARRAFGAALRDRERPITLPVDRTPDGAHRGRDTGTGTSSHAPSTERASAGATAGAAGRRWLLGVLLVAAVAVVSAAVGAALGAWITHASAPSSQTR